MLKYPKENIKLFQTEAEREVDSIDLITGDWRKRITLSNPFISIFYDSTKVPRYVSKSFGIPNLKAHRQGVDVTFFQE